MLDEFKKFAMRGNVIDMAVGIILGVAFGRIVTSFVNDIFMPPIGLIVGGVDFTDLFVTLGEGTYETLAAAQEAGAVTLNYGLWLNAVMDFVIVAFAIFMVVRQMNRLKAKEETAPAAPPKEEVLLTEIRDLLKARP